MKALRWRWFYLAIPILAGLMGYGFWVIQNNGAPSNAATESADDAASPADAAPQGVASVRAAPAAPVFVTTPRAMPAEKASPPDTGVRPMAMTMMVAPISGVDGAPLMLPAVTLNVTHATLDTVVQALNASLGPSSILRAARPNADGDKTFTLSASNQPFWDVFEALQEQHPLDLVGMAVGQPNAGLSMEQSATGIRRFASNGILIVYPLEMSYAKSGSGQTLEGELTFPHFTINLGVAVDPRITVLKFNHLTLRGKDGNGRAIAPPAEADNDTPANSNALVQEISWPAPEPRAKSASLKGELRFLAQLSESTVSIDNPDRHAGDTFAVGTRRARIGRFDIAGDRISFQVTAVDPDPQSVRIQYTIFDSTDKIVFSGFTATTPTGTAPANTFTPPYRITFHAADVTKDVTVDFELRDIPLP